MTWVLLGCELVCVVGAHKCREAELGNRCDRRSWAQTISSGHKYQKEQNIICVFVLTGKYELFTGHEPTLSSTKPRKGFFLYANLGL